MTTICIPASAYRELRAHGEEAYPLECCGALLGRPTPNGWQIAAILRAENVTAAPPHSHYQIAPAELVRIARQARALGLEIAGFYHSHPDGAAQWSATDLAEAHWLGASYVITRVAAGQAAETRSFRLTGATEADKQFAAEAVQVSGE